MVSQSLKDVPCYGVGLGYRPDLRSTIQSLKPSIGCLEVLVDSFLGARNAEETLASLGREFPLLPHGVGLSIGTVGQLDYDYLRAVKRLCALIHAPYYSEHLCFTRVPGIDLGHLAPLWFTEDMLSVVTEHVHQVQGFLEKTLVLENVTYFFDVPGGDLSQAEFFQRLVENTGCGILLDLTNVSINAANHGFDPVEWLGSLPLDHVVHMHLSGGLWAANIAMDTHSEPVPEEVWSLLSWAVSRCPMLKSVIFEYDAHFPGVPVFSRQLTRAWQALRLEPAEGPFHA